MFIAIFDRVEEWLRQQEISGKTHIEIVEVRDLIQKISKHEKSRILDGLKRKHDKEMKEQELI